MENSYEKIITINESIARFYDKVYDKLEFLKPAQKFFHEEIMNTRTCS